MTLRAESGSMRAEAERKVLLSRGVRQHGKHHKLSAAWIVMIFFVAKRGVYGN